MISSIFCLAPLKAAGQGNIGLNVWPPKIELSVLAGESQTGVLIVQNPTAFKHRVYAYPLNVKMSLYGELEFTEDSLSYGCVEWLSINPIEFDLPQGASQQVRYTIKVPLEAEGSHIGALFFHTKPQAALKRTGSQITARVGCIILETVPGSGEKKAEVTGLAVKKPSARGPAVAEITLKNNGSLLLRPEGTLEIKNDRGFTLGKLMVNENREAVFPFSQRAFRLPLENIEPGRYALQATLDYGGAEILVAEARVNLIADQAQSDAWPIIKSPAPTQSRQVAKKGFPVPVPKASPREIQNLLSQGTKLYAGGEYQQALGVWQKLLKLDPGNANAKKNLERTRQKLEAQKRAKG
ncbi:hypothetical protein HY768_08690 [candidate division TA06 bacterium]|uniref:Tetratricopeptide repeat protein n=1 Tax=candidate division TA06 bacterium TaxID=2250710 RepID=A0A933MK33_UNCT6|nr:hypothetical protein [candidate division TA06 bacterium]